MHDTESTIQILVDQINKIMNSINDDDPVTTLNETDLLIKTIDQKYLKEKDLLKIKSRIESILQDEIKLRQIRLNTRIKAEMETGIEYYDKDIGEDHRLFYDQKLEKDLIQINDEIRKLLAKLIKDKLNDEIEL